VRSSTTADDPRYLSYVDVRWGRFFFFSSFILPRDPAATTCDGSAGLCSGATSPAIADVRDTPPDVGRTSRSRVRTRVDARALFGLE